MWLQEGYQWPKSLDAPLVMFSKRESEVKVLVSWSCLTLCDPMDHSSPGSFVYGILQARILEWVAIPFSGDQSQVSHDADPGIEPRPPHCRQILCHLSHQGSPKTESSFSFLGGLWNSLPAVPNWFGTARLWVNRMDAGESIYYSQRVLVLER